MAETFRVAGIRLAYAFTPGRLPVVVFLPGFGSDMGGTKASLLRDACVADGQGVLLLDYAGHGASGGRLIDGCISEWAADAAHIIAVAAGDAPLLLVGSSMGGWIALLLATQLRARVPGMVLIAPAADFSERLILPALTATQKEVLQRDGVIFMPSAYDDPLPITQKLLEDGARHLLLSGDIPVTCPVRILHGMRDEAVPWALSVQLAACLASPDVRLVLLKDGDHRLSREQDLVLLRDTVFALLGQDGGETLPETRVFPDEV